jgi:hypothetical protein
MKYTGYCYFAIAPNRVASFFTTRAPLTIECETKTYNMRCRPCSGLDNVGKCRRYFLRSSRAFCCSGPHSTFVEPHSTLKKGRLLSASFAMNLFSPAIWPASFCTSFLVFGGYIWRITFILSGLASMLFVDTKQPNTFPRVTLKIHFSELSLSLASHILEKVSVKSKMYEAFSLLSTTMSSK